MAVRICKKRIRGDWTGILTSLFIIICWVFAIYSTNCTIISPFFRFHGGLKNYLLAAHIMLSVLTLLTMLQCIASDPGGLHSVGNVDLLGWEYCDRCQSHRPPRSHHCRRCGRCIRKMDHHCPWINNCVGEDNVANFTQFLFYSMLMSIFTSALCLAYFVGWLPNCNSCEESPDVELSIKIEVSCLLFISTSFAAFTAFMLVDRVILISTDVTTLELMSDRSALKKSYMNPRKPSCYKLFSRVFGTANAVDWFMPYARRSIKLSYEYHAYDWQNWI